MFITFEGIEGSGKSLQMRRALDYLKDKGIECIATREPGGTDFGRGVRRILLETGGAAREPMCEMLLYLADRYQDLREIIIPALGRGVTVLSDRYHDATRAYQGAARGVPMAVIDRLAGILEIPDPDATILLDLDPEEGLSRARSRNLSDAVAGSEGRFEAEGLQFHREVRSAYLELARNNPQRIHVVSGSGMPDEVFSRVVAVMDALLPRMV